MSAIKWVVLVLLLGMMGGLGSSSAFAQDDKANRKRAKLVLDSGVLVGKIRKPSVQFLISREKGINQEAIELKESFLPGVRDATKENPF